MTIKKLRTKLKESEAEIENLLRQERAKADFIADATHEFRTPLAIIKGHIDLSLHDGNPAKEALRAIDKEVMYLSSLLSDLTLLTMQGQEFERNMQKEKLDLKDIIADVMERSKTLTLTDNNNMSIRMVGKMPSMAVYGHGLYLEKLFLNLINNGLIYGKKNGKVEISGKKRGNKAVITVRDNGIGIIKSSLPHIFKRFYRVDKTRASSHGAGMGLGLPISKWITELHSGTISAKSAGKDKGSTFTVTLPLVKKKSR